jgi:hypothetical protein
MKIHYEKPSQTRRWSRLKPNCYGSRNKKQNKNKTCKNKGIPKTQLGFSLDQNNEFGSIGN